MPATVARFRLKLMSADFYLQACHSSAAPVDQRPGDGAEIDILQLGPGGHAARQAGNAQAARTQGFGDDMRRRLAFVGEVGRQNHLFHRAVERAGHQPVEADFLRPQAIERADAAHEHEVQAVVGERLLYRGEIGGAFHHAKLAGVASGVGADAADRVFGEGVAARAALHRA